MKKLGTINPDDTLVDNLFDTQIERLSTVPEDKKLIEESKCSKFLKQVSFGQHNTPLYYQKNQSYSSKTGGIITLICGTLFTAYAIWVLISAIQGEDKILDMKTYDLSFANQTADVDVCENAKNCAKINLEQFINAYLDQDPVYCVIFDEDDWKIRSQSSKCNGLSMSLRLDNLNGTYTSLLRVDQTGFNPKKNTPRCCLNLTRFKIIKENPQVNFKENALTNKSKSTKQKSEYLARVSMTFSGILLNSKIIVNIQRNTRFTPGGISVINSQSPSIPRKNKAQQSLTFVKFNEYQNLAKFYLDKPDQVNETLQYISQRYELLLNLDNDMIQIDLVVEQEQVIYHYYSLGILYALSKLGGLLAILKISIIMNFLHRYWFEKEINDQIANNNIATDKEEGQQAVNAQNLYSIENFNSVLHRLKEVEEELKQLKLGKKDD